MWQKLMRQPGNWSLELGKNNELQSTLSKTDAVGTKISVRLMDVFVYRALAEL